MDILIRGIDAAAIAKIDELAKKKDMSRNRYIKMYLRNLSILGEMKAMEDRYVSLVNSLSETISHNTEELQELRFAIEKGGFENERK